MDINVVVLSKDIQLLLMCHASLRSRTDEERFVLDRVPAAGPYISSGSVFTIMFWAGRCRRRARGVCPAPGM